MNWMMNKLCVSRMNVGNHIYSNLTMRCALRYRYIMYYSKIHVFEVIAEGMKLSFCIRSFLLAVVARLIYNS